ncbi:MAG: hypothetical protein NDJ94_23155 [Vicinamibacteria bacterium]|nr:hypothetical protein [Vicinamibacteria bacterium]
MNSRVCLYVLSVDAGFSPNPFHGRCTLACCKPVIRRNGSPGDWVVGVTPARHGHRLAYAMKVSEVLGFADYWRDPRFRSKRPRRGAKTTILQRRGDNCYQPLADGGFRQLPSCHWDDVRDQENPVTKRTDLGGQNALVSDRFAYYGDAAREWREFPGVGMPARGHRVFAQAAVPDLVAFLDSLPQGVHGRPRRWPSDEDSWSEPRGRCG